MKQYCTVQDLEGYFLNKSFNCGDYLDNGKANTFILTDAAIINSYLRPKYSLPITDTEDLLILKNINEKMVVGTIDDIFREKTESGEFARTRGLRKEAIEMLEMIKSGEIELNSLKITSVIKFNSVRSDGENISPRFKDENIDKDF